MRHNFKKKMQKAGKKKKWAEKISLQMATASTTQWED